MQNSFTMRLLVVILTFILNGLHTTAFSPEDESKIDNFLSGVMSCAGIPGAFLSLVQNNQTLMTKGYGLANVESGEKVTSKTKMAIGSCTKAFSSALLASILSNSSTVTWDTPVREVFGDSFYFQGGYMSNQTSLRDLLGHKTGIPRHDFILILEAMTREELLSRIRFFTPVAPFRTEFRYNNIMHIAAGEVSRILSNSPFEDALQRQILDPLGMRNSVMIHKAAPSYDGFAIPYLKDQDGNFVKVPFESIRWGGSIAAAAGGLCSDAEDMAKWLHFQLSGGRDVNGSEVVDEGFLTRTHQSEIIMGDSLLIARPEFPVTDTWDNGALSWFNGWYRGYRTVAHGGAIVFSSLATMLPDMNIGVFTSVNSAVGIESNLIHAYVVDITLGIEPWLNTDLACEIIRNVSSDTQHFEPDLPIRWMSSSTGPNHLADLVDVRKTASRALEDYVGTYGNYAYGNLTISLNSGGTNPFLELSYGKIGRYQLTPSGQENEFLTEGIGPAFIWRIGNLQFKSSDNKTIDELQTELEPADPPLFKRDLKMDTAPPPPNNNC